MTTKQHSFLFNYCMFKRSLSHVSWWRYHCSFNQMSSSFMRTALAATFTMSSAGQGPYLPAPPFHLLPNILILHNLMQLKLYCQAVLIFTSSSFNSFRSIEEGLNQKARQRSSRLFGGQNLFNSLPR